MTAGGAWIGGRLMTWGRHLQAWTALDRSEKLLDGPFDIGCAFEDGVVVQKSDQLLYWRQGVTQLIDTGAAAVDLAALRLWERPGILVCHRGMQLRFFTPPSEPGARWPYREIYSFYTASEQGGLLFRDIDGDGRDDIVCGNYWVRRPPREEESWRLFAINLIHDHPLAASARLAWWRGRLLWLESKASPARAVWFSPPPDPKQLWLEQPLGFELHYPRAILARPEGLWVGENNGAASRVIEISGRRVIDWKAAIHALAEMPGGLMAIDSMGTPRPIPA